MATTKETLALAESVSNQEALVKSVLQKKKAKQVVFIIPGGKKLFQNEITKDKLTNTIYTWLRHTTNFSEMTLSFAKDANKFSTNRVKSVEFPETLVPVWEIASKGKMHLAKVLAEVIVANENIVAINVKKDGVYVLEDVEKALDPSNEAWEPKIIFTKSRISSYAVY